MVLIHFIYLALFHVCYSIGFSELSAVAAFKGNGNVNGVTKRQILTNLHFMNQRQLNAIVKLNSSFIYWSLVIQYCVSVQLQIRKTEYVCVWNSRAKHVMEANNGNSVSYHLFHTL